jgi:hypothetical protein
MVNDLLINTCLNKFSFRIGYTVICIYYRLLNFIESMWLKLIYDEEEIAKWPFDPKNLKVVIEERKTVSLPSEYKSFRISPIFPLLESNTVPSLGNTSINFYHYPNPYRILGRIKNIGSGELKSCIFFTSGLASIILITNDKNLHEEFIAIANQKEIASEIWKIKDSNIYDISPNVNKERSCPNPEIVRLTDYSCLPSVERALIDEFIVSTQLLLLKMPFYMPAEEIKIRSLINEVETFVKELVYLQTLEGPIPDTLPEFTVEDFKKGKTAQTVRHQVLDRIIQINSALSYVSTQAFSGAIPILERRSLVRRNSLLGIGGAMLALNNIVRFIEESFSKVNLKEIILKHMVSATPLSGMANWAEYDPKEWKEGSINVFTSRTNTPDTYIKLPYFSSRLGFRETEFSIAAAIQSISGSANLEWSLLTLTHEMLHGHVREIISYIFSGGEKMNGEAQRNNFYENFKEKYYKKRQEKTLIESIRNVFFIYCTLTYKYGSLTKKVHLDTSVKFVLLEKDMLWNILELENRNISEIFVHVLDLHYFYGSRVEVYIPLIWGSWLAVPHVNGNLRQYILRSLVTIASKNVEQRETFKRFNSAVEDFRDILERYCSTAQNPIIEEVLTLLNDKKKLKDYYFGAFKASLIIVDLVTEVFTSEEIRGHIFNDDFASWVKNETEEESREESFVYNLGDGFNDEQINSPIAYLLAKMIKALNAQGDYEDKLERETVVNFLSLNSSYWHGK